MTLTKERRLVVDHGRVACPLRGDRDVEQCFSCPNLEGLRLNGPKPTVICRVTFVLPSAVMPQG